MSRKFEVVNYERSGRTRFEHSGKKFVLALSLTILVIWGTLSLSFRIWKAGYDERAANGRVAAAAIRPFVESCPPEVDLWIWEDTVDHTESMLIAVTGSNLLSEMQLKELSEQVDQLLKSAQENPSRSVGLLRSFWDEVGKKAGPIAEIYGRPQLIRNLPDESES